MAKRMSYGNCEICGHRTTKGHMVRHLRKCLEIEEIQSVDNREVFQRRKVPKLPGNAKQFRI